MAKLKQVSFVVNEGDALLTYVQSVAEEYEIPLNSALKVAFKNLLKIAENQNELPVVTISKPVIKPVAVVESKSVILNHETKVNEIVNPVLDDFKSAMGI